MRGCVSLKKSPLKEKQISFLFISLSVFVEGKKKMGDAILQSFLAKQNSVQQKIKSDSDWKVLIPLLTSVFLN